jgi:hypothetical protein
MRSCVIAPGQSRDIIPKTEQAFRTNFLHCIQYEPYQTILWKIQILYQRKAGQDSVCVDQGMLYAM